MRCRLPRAMEQQQARQLQAVLQLAALQQAVLRA
jgi:hypothetical protein